MKKCVKKQTSTVKLMSGCRRSLTRNPRGKGTAEILALGNLIVGYALPD